MRTGRPKILVDIKGGMFNHHNITKGPLGLKKVYNMLGKNIHANRFEIAIAVINMMDQFV